MSNLRAVFVIFLGFEDLDLICQIKNIVELFFVHSRGLNFTFKMIQYFSFFLNLVKLKTNK